MHVVSAQVLERWGTLTDEQIVEQVIAGQTALFEVLMRRHNERVYRAARAVIRDEAEAEDVMQQAYVNAYAHLRQFGGRSKFSTWLARIASTRRLPAHAAAAGNHRPPIPSVRRSPRSSAACWNGRSTHCRTAPAKCSSCATWRAEHGRDRRRAGCIRGRRQDAPLARPGGAPQEARGAHRPVDA